MGYTGACLQMSKPQSAPKSVTHGLIPHVLNEHCLCELVINANSGLERSLFASTSSFSLV